MKNFLIILLLAFMLVSCSKSLTNQEIVKEKKFCEDNGMGYEIIARRSNAFGTQVEAVICK